MAVLQEFNSDRLSTLHHTIEFGRWVSQNGQSAGKTGEE
jgi:hypothetical protein